jgi:uncharacterized protein YodC (DUF2158 family)
MALHMGDVVALKSGGPLMTIQEMREDGAHCVWFDQGNPRYATFPVATVDKKSDSPFAINRGGGG